MSPKMAHATARPQLAKADTAFLMGHEGLVSKHHNSR
jgi:hypothetical protein